MQALRRIYGSSLALCKALVSAIQPEWLRDLKGDCELVDCRSRSRKDRGRKYQKSGLIPFAVCWESMEVNCIVHYRCVDLGQSQSSLRSLPPRSACVSSSEECLKEEQATNSSFRLGNEVD